MTILAIDPGYERLGIAVLKKEATDRKETLLFSECFHTSSKDTHAIRLGQIIVHLQEIITQYQPHTLAIETLFFSKNTKTALKVAEARGAIIATCAAQDLQVVEFSPQDIKIAVTGSGSSDKAQIIKMIPLLIPLPNSRKLDDEYDAIAIGLTYFATQRTIHN